MSLIEVSNLSLHRNRETVLCIPSLSISRGEVLAVVGPNGAGKSTLLLTLAGIIPPSEGKITFLGRQLEQWKGLDYRRQVALILQEPLLLDRSVLDNLLIALRFRRIPHKEAVRRASEWLNRFGIIHLAQRPARLLSGGEAQRVSIARAFVLEPQLLLLDEPFAALDPPTRAELLQELRALIRNNHQTTIFVTHHLNEAAFLGDRIAVLSEGTLKQVGTLEQIRTQPADQTVADFLAHFFVSDSDKISLSSSARN